MTVKTLTGKCDMVVELIAQLHSYEVPEILVQPVEKVSSSYLEWLNKEIE